MKYVKQFLLILFISFIGEIFNKLIPLPIPASIYGMMILFFGLLIGIIKLENVKEVGSFLIEIMPIMFIPGGVALVTAWDTLKSIIVPIAVISVVSTFLTMIVTGKVTELVMKLDRRHRDE